MHDGVANFHLHHRVRMPESGSETRALRETPTEPLVPVLVNRRAGIGGSSVEVIEEAFRRAGVPADVRAVTPDELESALRTALQLRPRVIAVAGGDGTMLAAARTLAGTETALGPVPTGTLNHFARRLGIDGIDAAAAAVASGSVSEVSLGIVDDGVFLNTATFGLYADVVRRREHLRRWLGKWPAATIAFAARILRLRELDLTFEVGGEPRRTRTPLLWIGMGRGSFPLVHESNERRSSPDLEVVVIRSGGPVAALRLLTRVSMAIRTRTNPHDDPGLDVTHARWMLIRSGHSGVGVTLDGEIVRLTPPVYIGVVDRALRVVAPA